MQDRRRGSDNDVTEKELLSKRQEEIKEKMREQEEKRREDEEKFKDSRGTGPRMLGFLAMLI